MSEIHHYRLWQDGMIVVAVYGPNKHRAWAEIQHYAAVYGQDGPCHIEWLSDDGWKVVSA